MVERKQYTVLQTSLLENYQALSLSNEEVMFLIHIVSFQQMQDDFPPIQALQKRMGYSQGETYDMIQNLIDKKFLSIESEESDQGQQIEYYSLDLLYQKLERLFEENHAKKEKQAEEKAEGSIFQIIEQEFGRPLSPIEYQQVAAWFSEDHYDVVTVKAAIKEAVLNGVLNLRYIDRILINWQKQNKKGNVETSLNYRNAKIRQQNNDLPPVPMTKVINTPDDEWEK